MLVCAGIFTLVLGWSNNCNPTWCIYIYMGWSDNVSSLFQTNPQGFYHALKCWQRRLKWQLQETPSTLMVTGAERFSKHRGSFALLSRFGNRQEIQGFAGQSDHEAMLSSQPRRAVVCLDPPHFSPKVKGYTWHELALMQGNYLLALHLSFLKAHIWVKLGLISYLRLILQDMGKWTNRKTYL